MGEMNRRRKVKNFQHLTDEEKIKMLRFRNDLMSKYVVNPGHTIRERNVTLKIRIYQTNSR